MEKKYFTREQLKALEPARDYFRTSVYERWKRGTTMSLNNLVSDIYYEATGKQLQQNWNCGSCSYNNYLTVGRMFFESEEHYRAMDGRQLTIDFNAVAEETEPEPVKAPPVKKVANNKRGRPKKKK